MISIGLFAPSDDRSECCQRSARRRAGSRRRRRRGGFGERSGPRKSQAAHAGCGWAGELAAY